MNIKKLVTFYVRTCKFDNVPPPNTTIKKEEK
jgi:hypothetical protein